MEYEYCPNFILGKSTYDFYILNTSLTFRSVKINI